MAKQFVAVGNWSTKKVNRGFSIFEQNPETGELLLRGSYHREMNAGAILADTERHILYVVDESEDPAGMGGSVLATQYDPKTGDITDLGAQRSIFPKPCSLCLDPTSKYLVAAHHGSRQFLTKLVMDAHGKPFSRTVHGDNGLTMFRLGSRGELKGIADLSISDPSEEMPSVMHSVRLDPTGELLIAVDVDREELTSYHIDSESGTLRKLQVFRDEAGKQSRYAVFHPTLPFYYKNNEQQLSLDVFSYDTASGKLVHRQNLPYLQDLQAAETGPVKYEVADILFDRSARHLYISVRKYNLIVCFDVAEDGMLTEKERTACEGESPRGLCLSPDGKYLYCMNDVSESITYFRVGEEGQLNFLGAAAEACPGCMAFL